MAAEFLVVGAGLSGAVVARLIAEAGHTVDVVEARNHIAGNCYDYCHPATGERIQMYGAHLLHHGSDMLHEFLSRFTEWTPYEHKVRACYGQKTTSLPVNMGTLNDFFGLKLDNPTDTARMLHLLSQPGEPENAEELFRWSVGDRLAETFFLPYTQKQWGKPASEVPVKVGKRLPVRFTDDDRYFTDKYQYLPAQGYTAMVQNMLNHENITVTLGTFADSEDFDSYTAVLSSQPIDQLCDYDLGRLPYRSVQFKSYLHDRLPSYAEAAVMNFTGDSGPTREIFWSLLPGNTSKCGKFVGTQEYPCDAEDNIGPTGEPERYYPVETEESTNLYADYVALAAERFPNVKLMGRLGKYQYLDMAPACLQAMQAVKTIL